MEYNIIAVLITFVGLFILFSKQMVKMSLLSFFMTLVLFISLIVKEYYLLAFAFLLVDILTKFELFLFLTNKNLLIKKTMFRQQQYFKKIMVSVVFVIMLGIVHTYYKLKNKVDVDLTPNNLELLTVGSVITIFIISGYIMKSRRWKQ